MCHSPKPFSLEIASYCEREMSTGLERHTNEDGAYPKAGGHTLRFVKYVELKSLFSRHFSSKICAQAARSARLLPRHQVSFCKWTGGQGPGRCQQQWTPVDAEVSAFETRLQLKQWELDLRVVVYLKSSKSWINDTSSSSTTIISQKERAQLMPWTAWSSQDGSQLMLSVLRLLKCIERV